MSRCGTPNQWLTNAMKGYVELPAMSRQNLLIRGTPEWDQRERERKAQGKCCLSFGPIPKGLGFGETMTRSQRTNLLKARDGHWDTMKVTR